MNILAVKKRSKTDKLASIRNNGMIPAVVYGAREKNQMISVSSVEFEKILKIAGESSTIVLELEADIQKKELAKKIDVLIHDVQVDPIKGFPIHIDFLAIDMNKEVRVNVPIVFSGISPAEKNGLGVLVKVMHEVEIEALPKNLPNNLEVDLSVLVNLDDQIHVNMISIAKGIKLISDGDEVVALIAPIKEEVIDEAPVDLSSIEVEKKGKKDMVEENTEKTEDNNS
jgi:large subunit ribosomal protein L25